LGQKRSAPSQKALAALLHLSYNSGFHLSGQFILLSQVIESLYLKKEDAKAKNLNQLIPAVLGQYSW
jgi:hypothetical protein